MSRGYLRYRKIGSSQWIYKDTNTQIVYHKDGDCTIHRCIVRNLPEGTYEYQCGDEGYWGDVYTFVIKSYQTSDGTPDRSQHIKFLQVSDQQSFYEDDYEAWRWASKYIEDHENPDDYDWVLNTGDISQSGNRSFEWRSYYKFPRFLREKCHILCCGNNDLFDKKYSNCFKYYDTTEHDFNGDIYSPNFVTHSSIQGKTPYGEGNYSSIWTFDLGYVHFINVNSNMTADVEDPDIWVKQMVWLKAELEQVRQRPNPPRWYIMLTHYGALTVTRMKVVQQMIPFVEDLGIHLVICGHHHSYSRSQPVKMNIRAQVEAKTGHDLYDIYDGCGQAITNAVYKIGYLETFLQKDGSKAIPKGVTHDQTTENGTLLDGSQGVVTNGNVGSRNAYVNQEKGTYWVMCNATGSKLKSNKDLEKDPTPWWYGWAKYNEQSGLWANNPHPYHPNYIMWDISYDSITLKSYTVHGIMQMDSVLKDAVVIPPDKINYAEMSRVLIDEYTIPWRDLSVSPASQADDVAEENETTEE